MLKRIKIGVIVVLMALLFLFLLILKSHSFQAFVINRLVTPIEKKSNIDIDFSHFGFDIIDGFFIEGLHVKDRTGKDLLSLQSLKISPKSTLLSLIKNDFSFDKIYLHGAKIFINGEEEETDNNWERLFASLQSEPSTEEGQPLNLFVRMLDLEDVRVIVDDKRRGFGGFADFEKFQVTANKIDLSHNLIDLERILLVKPSVHISSCFSRQSTEEDVAEPSGDSPGFPHIKLQNLGILDANLSYNYLDLEFNDVSHSVSDGDVVLSNIAFKDVNDFTFSPVDISLKYGDDLVLDHVSSTQISSSNNELSIEELTVRSSIGLLKLSAQATGSSEYWHRSLEELSINAVIDNSFLDMYKLGSILPNINKQKWYRHSSIGKIYFSGDVNGTKNDLKLSKTKMVVPELFSYTGEIELSNVESIESALMNIMVDGAKVHLDKINSRLPNIKIPKEIERLGAVEIQGQFDGFVNNFVADAMVKSDLGNLTLDLNFDIEGENQYSGLLGLNSFDLGQLLGVEDIGKISLNADISEGKGLDLDDINAHFFAKIDTFEYKGYAYQNARFSGRMSDELVDGKFEIDDGTVAMDFEGNVDFSQGIPNANFIIDIDKVNLCHTNLASFPCEVTMKASINMFGKDLNSLQGEARLDSIFMKKEDEELFMDFLEITSTEVDQGMLFELTSNELDAKVRGVFDLRTMHKVLLSLLVSDYPDIADRLNVKSPSGLNGDEEFDFAIDIKDMTKVLDFVNSKQILELDGELRGRWSAAKGLTSNSYNLRNVGFNGISLSNVLFNLDSKKGDGSFTLFIDELLQGDRIIDGFEISSKITESEIFFEVKNHEGQKDKVNIQGVGNPWGNGFKFVFDQNVLLIDSVDWVLNPDAQIGYRDKQILIENFILEGDERSIVVDDIMGKGLSLLLQNFDFSIINPIVNYDKMYFDGVANVDIKAKNLFTEREVAVDINVDDFTINKDAFGEIDIHATEGTNGLIDLSVKIEKDTQSLDVLAYYSLEDQLLNADISILDYPMTIFEYIIDDGISQTVGTTDVNARIYGPLTDLKLQGQGIIKNGGTRIDYIGEFYRLGDQAVKIDESFLDMNDVELIDHLGNIATIKGGLTHDFLADFKADLSISSPYFIGLNTSAEDNDLYYGLGLGDISVSFLGPFDAIDIRVDAKAGEGTVLNIPLESSDYSLDQGFVNFDYKSEIDSSNSEDPFEAIRLSGADFEMKLTLEPEANVNVIFDQSVDEVLRANGDGDLRIIAKRDGTFEVFGNYLVESGEYLYSAYGVTAKRFQLRRGGEVRWTGDPYNAILNVKADYGGLRAPLDIFLSEFIVSASSAVQTEAKNRTDVALELDLGGTLFKPDVNFDISFPNVTGELKTYTDNKMRALRTTENGINNQVFGLMILNNFLPSNNPLANLSGSTLGQTGSNTITEFFSSQLSLLVSDALSDLIKDGTFINDIDLDIALSQNTSLIGNSGIIGEFVDFVPDQVGVNVKPSFKNDNWALTVGTNYVRASEVNNVNYLTGDFALDWFITNDKKLKLRFYGDFDYDEAFASRKQKYGFGINYRREFGKMSDLTETLKNIAAEIKEKAASQ